MKGDIITYPTPYLGQSDKIISPLSYTFIEILIFVKIFIISHNERNSKFISQNLNQFGM